MSAPNQSRELALAATEIRSIVAADAKSVALFSAKRELAFAAARIPSMKQAPFIASEMSVAARRFLYACAFWTVAADEELKPSEQAWLVEQFGEEGITHSLEEFVALESDAFFQAFDGAAGALSDSERQRLFPALEDWLISCVEADDQESPAEREMIQRIKERLGIGVPAHPPKRAAAVQDGVTSEEVGLFEGHGSEVVCVALRPDGRIFASGAEDGAVILWDLDGRKEVRRLEGHELGVGGLAFMPDGRRLIAADRLGVLRAWDAETGALLWDVRRRRQGGFTALAVSADGTQIASASDIGLLTLWTTDGRERLTLGERRGGAVRTVGFSADSRWIASGGDDRRIHLWDAASGIRIRSLDGHQDGVTSVCFSPDGSRLLSGSRDAAVAVWDAAGGMVHRLSGHAFIVGQVCFAGRSRCGASASWDHTVRIWDVEAGRLLFTLESEAIRFSCLAMHPDGTQLLAGGSDKALHLVQVRGLPA